MSLSRLLRCAAVAAACASAAGLSACGGSTSPHGHSQPPCRYAFDSVSPVLTPLIKTQPPGSARSRAITATTKLPCETIVSVGADGTADLRFGATARCQVRQIDPTSGKIARLISRDPANAFFRLSAGLAWCTVRTSPRRIPMCGQGTLLLTGIAQSEFGCARDPVFDVAVFRGSVRVVDPNGARFELTSGQELTFDFDAHKSTVEVAEFSVADVAIFTSQAAAMHLPVHPRIRPQTIMFTSTVPANASPGDSYTVTAIGGGSGNPVTFAIDPASSEVCRISGQTVTFSGPGTCTIDANQAGNALYQAAPQAQQSIAVNQSQRSQTIMFTSTAPASAGTGDRYVVTAIGGGSGNPVTFAIDPASSKVCRISGQTVVFSGAGTCTIDANQAGNAEYQAAPQAQQSITVVAPG